MINQNLLLAGDDGYNLTNSLRFRSSASAYLNRTFASVGNQKTWTMSFWVKRGRITSATTQEILGCYSSSSDTGNFEFRFTTSDTLQCYLWNGGTTTNAVFRDPSAWYHVVLVIDTTQAGTSSGSKIKMYVNNVLQTFSSDYISGISQNTNLIWNATTAEYIGRWYASDGGTYYPDVYLSEMNFIDGQALTPSSFGSTNALTGVWQPARYTGTYGTNGFYLPFTDNSALTTSSNVGLGKDFSGNGNYWTTNNISITAGTTYDSMTDVPTLTSATTANYCVLNPLDKATSFNVTGGNLNFAPANTSDLYSCRSTIQIPSTGKWIWEVTNTNSAYMITAGLLNGSTPTTGQQTVSCAGMTVGSIGTFFSTTQWMNTTTSWSVTNIGNGDTLVIAYDADAGKIWFGRVASGGTTVTWYNTSGTADPSTGTDPRASGITAGGWFAGFGTYYTPSGASANFGQRPFAFTNTPTGFVALNTFNLPNSTIVAGNKQMDVTTYTGNGTAGRVITMSNMNNVGLAWLKLRSGADDHRLANTVTGGNRHLKSNATDVESTGTNVIQAFSGNTFTIGSDSSINGNGSTYVGWVWANDGTSGSTNTAGSISSQVSANTTSGFSVVTYTGTGSVATIGHGLGVKPSMIIFKVRSNGTYGWYCYNANIGATNHLVLNTLANSSASSFLFNDTEPTSSVMTVGTSAGTNQSGQTYVAYCWAEVAGFSKFGNYVGNGSTDGTFVYTGFRPKFVIFKSTGVSANDWIMYDTSRNTYNVMGASLVPNSAAAENAISLSNENTVDFLANGFKLRQANYANNGPSVPYIYMAFAENPFKNSLAR